MKALITTLLIVALFLLLGSASGSGWAGRRRMDRHGTLSSRRPRRHAVTIWGRVVVVDADRIAAFRVDGRDPLRTRLSEDMFKGLAPWLERLPGRLLPPTSSAARSLPRCRGRLPHVRHDRQMTLPELKRRGYPKASPSARSRGRARSGC